MLFWVKGIKYFKAGEKYIDEKESQIGNIV